MTSRKARSVYLYISKLSPKPSLFSVSVLHSLMQASSKQWKITDDWVILGPDWSMVILQVLCKNSFVRGSLATSFGPNESGAVSSVPLLQNDNAPLQASWLQLISIWTKVGHCFQRWCSHDPCPKAVYWFKKKILPNAVPWVFYLGFISSSAVCR